MSTEDKVFRITNKFQHRSWLYDSEKSMKQQLKTKKTMACRGYWCTAGNTTIIVEQYDYNRWVVIETWVNTSQEIAARS